MNLTLVGFFGRLAQSFFNFFYGHTHSLEVPRLGIESEPQLQPLPQLWQFQIF